MRSKNIMEGVWEAIVALGTLLFACYGALFSKASKREVQEFKSAMEIQHEKYATKEEYKNFKEEILRVLEQNKENFLAHTDDRFDTVLAMLGALETKKIKTTTTIKRR